MDRGRKPDLAERRGSNPYAMFLRPEWQEHMEQVRRGEVRFGRRAAECWRETWRDVPRRRRRVVLFCRHGLRGPSAPWLEVGGLTSDRVYSLTDDRFLDSVSSRMPLACPRCQQVWFVPLAELERIARSRGHRLLPQLIDQVPGVSVDLRTGSK